jgi:hypothetical protein
LKGNKIVLDSNLQIMEETMQPIAETMQNEKPKRFYPKRLKWDDSKKKAICILRDDGGFPFGTISKLLGNKDKRNTIYTYNQNKDRFSCQRGQNIVHIEDENKI